MTKKLVVLGSVNADQVMNVPRFPKPGETLVGSNYRIAYGGKGANQAVAAGRAGANISFIATIGDDDIGARMKAQFVIDGIDISPVMTITNSPTGVAMIWVSSEGENSIAISAGANAELTPERLAAHHRLIEDADVLLMQLESPLQTVEAAAVIAKNAGTKVILNPAPAAALPQSLLQLVDVITPNETEAEALTGIHVETDQDAQKAADALHAYGIETVLITLGARGVWLSEAGKGRLISGFRVQAVDTTAAGDTFNGAFVTAQLEGLPLDDAIRFAHAAAAISVTRPGAQPSVPTREEIDAFLKTRS